MLWRKDGSSAWSHELGQGLQLTAVHCFTVDGSHQHAACGATQTSPHVQ